MSEYQEYCEMLDGMGLILNQKLIDKLKVKLANVVSEIREEEKRDAMKLYNISDLAFEIETKLSETKKNIATYKEHPTIACFHVRIFYHYLLKKLL